MAAGTPEIIDALPELAQGGAWLLLAGVLIYLVIQFWRQSQDQDRAHREERDKQDIAHQARMTEIMTSHSAERKEWVTSITAAGDKYAKAQAAQGERIAKALEKALARPRSK